jgi:hypothetical protein
VDGTLRVQNLQFELLESESERFDGTPTPTYTCNGPAVHPPNVTVYPLTVTVYPPLAQQA